MYSLYVLKNTYNECCSTVSFISTKNTYNEYCSTVSFISIKNKNTYSNNTYNEYTAVLFISTVQKLPSTYNEYVLIKSSLVISVPLEYL